MSLIYIFLELNNLYKGVNMFLFWFLLSLVVLFFFHIYKDRIFFVLLIGTIVTSIICLFTNSSLIHLGTFALATYMTMLYFRHFKDGKLFRTLKPINLQNLVGRQAIVVKSIGGDTYEVGQVKLNGDIWYAKSIANLSFERGDKVAIVGIKGLFVYVESIH